MVNGTGESPSAESGEGSGYRGNPDIAQNFPTLDALSAQSPSLKPLSASGYIGSVFSTGRAPLSSKETLAFPLRFHSCRTQLRCLLNNYRMFCSTGRTLAGWKHVGPGSMVVENGEDEDRRRVGLFSYTPEKVSCVSCSSLRERESASGVFIRELRKSRSADGGTITLTVALLYTFIKALTPPIVPLGELTVSLVR